MVLAFKMLMTNFTQKWMKKMNLAQSFNAEIQLFLG
jgi:hypothetical protein